MLFGPSLCFKGGAYRKPWPCSVNEVEGESLCWEEVVRFDCSVEFEKVGADSEVISFIKGMGAGGSGSIPICSDNVLLQDCGGIRDDANVVAAVYVFVTGRSGAVCSVKGVKG